MSAKLPDRFTILYYLASMNHRREFFFSWTIKKEQITFEHFYILYNVTPCIVDSYCSQYKLDYVIKIGDFMMCCTCCISDDVTQGIVLLTCIHLKKIIN